MATRSSPPPGSNTEDVHVCCGCGADIPSRVKLCPTKVAGMRNVASAAEIRAQPAKQPSDTSYKWLYGYVLAFVTLLIDIAN